MLTRLQILMKYLPWVAGPAAMWFGVDRWRWAQTLGPGAFSCLNCYFGAVMPVEIGLLGLLAVIRSIPGRQRPWSGFAWSAAVLGVLTTPIVSGVPLFALAFVNIAWSCIANTNGATGEVTPSVSRIESRSRS